MSAQPASNARSAVLVTGGSKRIGRAIALAFAAQGWDVAVHCHRHADEAAATLGELRALGVRAAPLVADLGDEGACQALLPDAVAQLGAIDAVVNNASLFEDDDVGHFTYAAMDRHWRVNTAAPVVLARALHRHLERRGAAGCVVNVLDQRLWNPNPDHFSYTLSKAALEAAGTMLALALAPTLRVCGLAPGVTLPSGPMGDAAFERAHRLTPLNRSSTPEDIARAAWFLVASPAITGTTLLVDGGQHLSAQRRDVRYLVEER